MVHDGHALRARWQFHSHTDQGVANLLRIELVFEPSKLVSPVRGDFLGDEDWSHRKRTRAGWLQPQHVRDDIRERIELFSAHFAQFAEVTPNYDPTRIAANLVRELGFFSCSAP